MKFIRIYNFILRVAYLEPTYLFHFIRIRVVFRYKNIRSIHILNYRVIFIE